MPTLIEHVPSAVLNPQLASEMLPAPGASENLHQRSLVLDGSKSLYDGAQIGLKHDPRYETAVVSEVSLPAEDGVSKDTFGIARITRKEDGANRFVLVGLQPDEKTGKLAQNGKMYPLEQDKDTVLGRSKDADVQGDRLWDSGYSSEVSRKHLQIRLNPDETIALHDMSTNGTSIKYSEGSGNEVGSDDEQVDWTYTLHAVDVSALRRENEEARGKIPRHSIGRDSRLSEGVYEGSYGGEAITLDYEDDPAPIDDAIAEVVRRASEGMETGYDKHKLLNGVFDVVSERMRYDSDAVKEIFKSIGGKDGTKISLAGYIDRGVGVCRHQALYAGLVIEKLVDQGMLRGSVSVDRNMVKGRGSDKYDGHAWVRYTNSEGKVMILDVAQQKIGYLDNLMQEHRENPKTTWNYARPSDSMQSVVHAAGIVKPES